MGNIGLCFVNPSPQIKSDHVTTLAKKCEQIGLHSFWVIDRIAYDNLEPLSVLATAAAVTHRIRIGTSVLLAALRHPVLLAKTVSTLDFLSSGRLTLGIGFGSRENDFDSVGVPFKGRGSRAEEAIALMKRLWTEERITHCGRFYQVESTVFGPRPVQSPHPPIWMGGGAEIVLRRVARLADGYICGSSAIQDFPSLWEKISAFAQEAGRNAQQIEKAGLTFMAIDDKKERAVEACAAYLDRYYGKVRMDVERHLLVGPAEFCAERIRSFFQKGLTTLIIGQVTPEPRQLDLFGEKVFPLVKP
ncbi:MAG: LLM class flavin-dependent oxidoreductase [Candidatus Binatia bacterium]